MHIIYACPNLLRKFLFGVEATYSSGSTPNRICGGGIIMFSVQILTVSKKAPTLFTHAPHSISSLEYSRYISSG